MRRHALRRSLPASLLACRRVQGCSVLWQMLARQLSQHRHRLGGWGVQEKVNNMLPRPLPSASAEVLQQHLKLGTEAYKRVLALAGVLQVYMCRRCRMG